MFNRKKQSALHNTNRYGKVDVPAASEDTLEKFNQLYNRMIEGSETITALVLGATPELRDIVLANGHKLITIDRDEEAVREKSLEMHYKNHPNEEIILQDWLDIDFPENTFDVILGDGVLTSLNKDQQQLLLDELYSILKPTGSLLLREAAVIHKRPRYAPSVHVHEYRTGQYNIFDLFFGLRLYNHKFISIDKDTRKTYLKEFNEQLAKYVDDGVLSKTEQAQLNSVAAELEHTMLHKEDLENLLKSSFYSKDIIHDVGSGNLSPWYFFLTQPTGQIDLPKHVPTKRVDYVKDFLNSQTDSEE